MKLSSCPDQIMNITVGTDKKQISLSLGTNATVGDLKREYAGQTKKSIHRLSFKTQDGKTRLDDDKKALSTYGVNSGDRLVFKVCVEYLRVVQHTLWLIITASMFIGPWTAN